MDVEKPQEGKLNLNLPKAIRDHTQALCIPAGCDNLLKISASYLKVFRKEPQKTIYEDSCL